MALLVDYREDSRTKGSRGLWDDLKRTSLPIERATLDAGDLMFVGHGPEGHEVTVGVEFKKIRELLGSIRSERLQGHQFPKLQQYDYRWLLIEGTWKHDEQGLVTLRAGRTEWRPAQGRFSASELDKRLLGFTLRAGVLVWTTATRRDTVRWIESLYRDFTDRPWDAHTSHTAIYRPSAVLPISAFRTTVSTFPGVGVKTSKQIEQYFGGSLRKAVAARASVWSEIAGIGTKGARRIDEFLK